MPTNIAFRRPDGGPDDFTARLPPGSPGADPGMVVQPYVDPGYGMPNAYVGNLNQSPGLNVGGWLRANALQITDPAASDNPLLAGTPSEGAALTTSVDRLGQWLAEQRAKSAKMGLWNETTGLPTGAGLVSAAQQYGNALMMGTTAPGETVTLYHGTSPEGLADIRKTGRINGPAFFSPKKTAAADYAGGGPVIEVKVPKSALKVDFDLPGGQLLNVDDANGYSGKEGWSIDDYLHAGHSVGTDGHVSVKGATFHEP